MARYMVLLYSQVISSRFSYAAGFILETILGLEWRATNDTDLFRSYAGPKVSYGDKKIAEREVHIHASGFLSETGVRRFVPDVSLVQDVPVIFPSTRGNCDLGYDVFAATFYFLSRYEEYLSHKKDRFGRFEAGESLAFKNGFLERPVIDQYAMQLNHCINQVFSLTNHPKKTFSFLPTIDVDVAYAYRGRGPLRTLVGVIKDVFRGEARAIKERWQVLKGNKTDPFDTYDLQYSLHTSARRKVIYFFLCGNYGRLDKNISPYSVAFQSLVMTVAGFASAGIHPSAASNNNNALVNKEIGRLSALLKTPVGLSRQHYLMLKFPDTYQGLLQHQITHDFTLGYASQPGFRAGTCTPFYFYDLSRESATNLTLVPLTVMDGTLRDYLGLKPAQATQRIRQLAEQVRLVNGTFVSVWHNDAFSEKGSWLGWRSVYEEMLTMLEPAADGYDTIFNQ